MIHNGNSFYTRSLHYSIDIIIKYNKYLHIMEENGKIYIVGCYSTSLTGFITFKTIINGTGNISSFNHFICCLMLK